MVVVVDPVLQLYVPPPVPVSVVVCPKQMVVLPVMPAVGSGFYVMVKPLSKGSHTIHYHMSVPVWPAVQDGTFNVTVQ